jgi:peptide chain release factor
MEKIIIQITAGKGPLECCRVVARVQERMLAHARKIGIEIEVLANEKADLNGTLSSSTILAKGPALPAFVKEWRGTVQWIGKSPYRKLHKRKNWFVGVEVFNVKEVLQWDAREVTLETCRASGPGGQNVNKVETAVRGTHRPSGIQVLAMDSRSQLQNKKLCLKRLEDKVMAWTTRQLIDQQRARWQEHQSLERGNAVKTIIGQL